MVAYYGVMYGECLMKGGRPGDAIDVYHKALEIAESRSLTGNLISVQSILCQLLICCVETNDFGRFEFYARRFVDYAEQGKFGCVVGDAYYNVGCGYFLLSTKQTDESVVTVAEQKALEFSRKAYETAPADSVFWSSHVSFVLNFQKKYPVSVEILAPLAMAGQQLMIDNPEVDEIFIKYLGKLFIVAGMDGDFYELVRRYPQVVFGRRVMENYALLLENESEADKREEYRELLLKDIGDFFLIITSRKLPVPVDYLVSVIRQSGEGETIADIYLEIAEEDPLPSVTSMMLAACIFRGLGDKESLGDKERGDAIERELVTSLLEGEHRDNSTLYQIYSLFKSDCPHDDYKMIRKYLLDHFVSEDVAVQEWYELVIDGLYDQLKAKQFVEKVCADSHDYNRFLEDEAALFIKYSSESVTDAFVQFCRSLNEERQRGKALSETLLQTISEAAEKILGELWKNGSILNVGAWREIYQLIRYGNIVPGSNTVMNGLCSTEGEEQYGLYKDYYARKSETRDNNVGIVYLRMLYNSEGKEDLFEEVLAEMDSRVRPGDEHWAALQTELMLNYRKRGEYSAAMDVYGRLYDYYVQNNMRHPEHTIYFPLVTSLLADDYESYHIYTDRLKYKGIDQKIAAILKSTYLLKVDNFLSAERLYAAIRPVWNGRYVDTGEKVPGATESEEEESDLEEGQTLAYTAYHFIELARYHFRHKDEADAKAACQIAKRLLDQLPDTYIYLHNELEHLSRDLSTVE